MLNANTPVVHRTVTARKEWKRQSAGTKKK